MEIPGDGPGEIIRPADVAPCADPEEAVREALDNPVGSPPLEEVVKAGQTVAVIVDDVTRMTPVHEMLPPVLERLHSAGARREEVFIAVALGTHLPMIENEIRAKLGPEVADRYEIVNEPAWEPERMIYLGESKNGIPAWVNRRVAEAGARIGIGSVTPHMDAGYSGGAKIILPGVCSVETVNAFHARAVDTRGNQLGVVETLLRTDLEDFVEDRVGLDFIVNAALTSDGRLYQTVAGHFREAHRHAISFSDEVYAVAVGGRYPVVVSNAFPNDLDLWQSTKALWSGELVTADGGLLILTTPCPRGTEVHPAFVEYAAEDPDDLERRLKAGEPEDPCAAAIAVLFGRMKRRVRMAMVTPGLSRRVVERMGFDYYFSVEEAVSAGLADAGTAGRLAVLSHGGVTLPRPS
jgi:nickel-dependent lactate racemase